VDDHNNVLAVSPEGANPRFDLLLEAVGESVRANGLEGATIEDVAAISGVSRATMYRRFGSRDGMLKAYLARRSSRLIQIGRELAAGPGDLNSRLEDILTFMVNGVNRAPWIKRERSGTDDELVQAAARRFFDQVVVPMLSQAETQGHWERPAPLAELLAWLTDEYFVLVRLRGHDEAEVRRHIRTYIMPVLNLRTSKYDVEALSTRIEALQQELSALSELLSSQVKRKPPGSAD
jgi:AcrR family transcriptional regulator